MRIFSEAPDLGLATGAACAAAAVVGAAVAAAVGFAAAAVVGCAAAAVVGAAVGLAAGAVVGAAGAAVGAALGADPPPPHAAINVLTTPPARTAPEIRTNRRRVT